MCAVVALVAGWTTSPYVFVKFSTSHPDAAFIKSDDDCTVGTDALEYISRPIDNGRVVSVELCFKARRVQSGAQIVPYGGEIDSWWGDTPYTSDVMAYTEARAKSFNLSEADKRAAQDEWTSQRTRNIGYGVGVAVAGWIVLSLLQMLIGWIVRGFLGIPRGQDRRPELATSAD